MHLKRSVFQECMQEASEIPNFDPYQGETMLSKWIEPKFKVKVFCWTRHTKNGKYELVRNPPMTADDVAVDVIVDLDQGQVSLFDASVILDSRFLVPGRLYKRKEISLFEAIAITKNNDIRADPFSLRRKRKELEEIWHEENLDLSRIEEFCKTFDIGLEIWSYQYIADNRMSRKGLLKRQKLIGQEGIPLVKVAIENFVGQKTLSFDQKMKFLSETMASSRRGESARGLAELRKQREGEKSENISTDPKLFFTDLDYDSLFPSFDQ